MIGYIARDKYNDRLYFHYNMPVKDEDNEWWWSDYDSLGLRAECFPEFEDVTYDDEPIKVELNIKRI